MKALIIVTAFCALYLVVLTIVFRTLAGQRRVGTMLRLWLASVFPFVCVYWLTPPDLGVLPSELSDTPEWAGLTFGLLVYVAGFFGGLLQLYNLTERGFSLRILIDLHETRTAAITVEDVIQGYSGGHGMDWMYQKRLDGLLEQHLIVVVGNIVENTPRGRRVALTVKRLRSFIRLGAWT